MVDSVDSDPPLTDDKGTGPAYERDVTLNILQRIHNVMVEVGGRIEKDGTAKIKGKTGGEFSYDYISHDACTAHIRAACIRHGIFVHPTVKEHGNNGNRTELTVDVRFINMDSQAELITVTSVGYGVDNSDKGPGKAWSYAVKYACLKLFMLNTADDIEGTDTPHDPDTKRESDVAAANQEARVAREAWAHSLRDSIRAAKSSDDIKEIKRIHKKALEDAPVATEGYFNAEFEKRRRQLEALEQPPVDA